jgi:hypothetical protein
MDTEETEQQSGECNNELETDFASILHDGDSVERDISHYFRKMENDSSDEDDDFAVGHEIDDDACVHPVYDCLDDDGVDEGDEYGEFVGVESGKQDIVEESSSEYQNFKNGDYGDDSVSHDITLPPVPPVDPSARIAPLSEGSFEFIFSRFNNFCSEKILVIKQAMQRLNFRGGPGAGMWVLSSFFVQS